MSKIPAFLVTDCTHFEVSYKINPWMTPDAWRNEEAQNRAKARQSQRALIATLKQCGARVSIMDGVAGLPDMVFPANAAVILNGRALVSRFRHHERQGEERHFMAQLNSFVKLGLLSEAVQGEKGCFQEGAGDCMWDASRQIFWAGFGQRSSFESVAAIKEFFDVPAAPLELVSSRFYHLDTCFVPLSGGEIIYFPPAFSKQARATIRERVPSEALIEASSEDAARFSVNAVNIGRDIILAAPGPKLAGALKERGYSVHPLELRPFIMAGGGAYCMTLRLDLKTVSADNKKG
jgi:N-dimethylarginine dimethylaminohydrolase